MGCDDAMLHINLADFAFAKGQVIVSPAGDPLPRRHARFDFPKFGLAIGQAQGSTGILAYEHNFALDAVLLYVRDEDQLYSSVPSVPVRGGPAPFSPETMHAALRAVSARRRRIAAASGRIGSSSGLKSDRMFRAYFEMN